VNLLIRVNLALAVVFTLGALTAGMICWSILEANAKREVLGQAGLMMDGALAIRAYTSSEIVPLLNAQMRSEFLPQSVPSYAATQNFLRLHDKHPDYAYKEATLNPTNPRDRAADWESDIIQRFRNDAQAEEVVGERDTPLGRSLYLARPIHARAACLACHSVPAAAPQAVLERYGSNNGFGWQVDEVVGAQVVSVPLARADASAAHAFRVFLFSLIGVFAAMLAVLNVLLYLSVVRPVRRMAYVADKLSLGDMSVAEIGHTGNDEIAALGRAFTRMRRSLDKTLQLLEKSTP
jgi:HAMP domain-containing protein